MLKDIPKYKRNSHIIIRVFESVVRLFLPYGNLEFALINSFKKIVEYVEFKYQILLKVAPKKAYFYNDENINEYNFSIPLCSSQKGISAVIRVKNEETKIYKCLSSIIDVFDEIIIVDNNSDDRTVDTIQAFQKEKDKENKIKIFYYPFKMSLFGSEYEKTPENSVYNFAYFSNYAISKCSKKIVCKWDADMVFLQERKLEFKNFVEKINNLSYNSVWNVYGQTVYKDKNENCWLSKQEIYHEPRIFSLSYFNIYVKGRYFEALNAPSLNIDISKNSNSKNKLSFERKSFPGVLFYELKFSNENELAHWTQKEVSHTTRKKREIKALQLLEKEEISENDDFTLISISHS